MSNSLVGGIKNRGLGYLEQAAERYAKMTYEVLRRELAMGLKSITYSYKGNPNNRFVGTFTAEFVPWVQTHELRSGHRATKITFSVIAEPEQGWWALNRGHAEDIEDGSAYSIKFSEDGKRIALQIPQWNVIRFGNGTRSMYIKEDVWDKLWESVTF